MTPRTWLSVSTTGTVQQVVVGHQQGHVDDIDGGGDPHGVGIVDIGEPGLRKKNRGVQQIDDTDRSGQPLASSRTGR